MRRLLMRVIRLIQMFIKGLIYLRRYGFRYTWAVVRDRLRRQRSYRRYRRQAKPLYTEKQLQEQRETVFSEKHRISILVPLYNTPESFLKDMIGSVLAQTCSDWELCLADGSDASHGEVEELCRGYARQDTRVLYRKLECNGGISENTNACIDMASGDYLALLDHDDLLHPAALHDVMKAICEQGADFIYTDETTFESPDVRKIATIHLKPDFAPDNLRANNYICHFTVFRRSLLEQTGAFRSAFDGSQDHDLVLRLTAAAEKIVHIPEVLYYWRAHPQSVASDLSAKSYAVTAGVRAVRDSLAAAGLPATVESSVAFPAIYRIRYALRGEPLISIVIPVTGSADMLKRCVRAIRARSGYRNFEILLAVSGGADAAARALCAELGRSGVKVAACASPNLYTAVNHAVRQAASGEYVLLLDQGAEPITPGWIEEMLMYAQREDVGAVGAALYEPNDTFRHAGIILGMGPDHTAGYAFRGQRRGIVGYMGRLLYAQNLSAVSGECMLLRRSAWDEAGGLDEAYRVSLGDIDLCLRLRQAGYPVVWTPHAEVYVRDRKKRRTPESEINADIFDREDFRKRWESALKEGDPYFNPNFDPEFEDFTIAVRRC